MNEPGDEPVTGGAAGTDAARGARGGRAYGRTRRLGRGRAALGRRAALAGAAAAGLALLSGCGIRATTVPVDAGPAPSRSQCAEAGGARATPSPRSSDGGSGSVSLAAAEIYLVCNSQVEGVTQPNPLRGGDALVARLLLAQLKLPPVARLTELGYSTLVRADLEISEARPGDPDGTLRLNTAPDLLDRLALGQIVCTLSANLRDGGEVILAGEDDDAPPRSYACDASVRTRDDLGAG